VAFEDDRRRDQLLKLDGWTVIRCTQRQVVKCSREITTTLARLLRQS
jgi:very-short-patch-repair endonuclease